jgi:hypothetical protein
MKMQTTSALVITPTLRCLLLPDSPAVLPPPDAGYPAGNTAEGQNAVLTLTTGGFDYRQ